MAVAGGRGAGGRGAAMRRYPALAYLAGAVALALLLPSGLTLPNSGPSTLAEYAPVPGQGEGTADVAELGQASSSGGPGFGRGPGTGATTSVPEQGDASSTAVLRRRPGNKRCVGDPPRQTEDPLSPPCVAYFEGDNFGATSQGVTADEVTVLVAADGGGSSTDRRVGTLVDCGEEVTDEDSGSDIQCKAFMRYFNDRYQTYRRVVHLWSPHGARTDVSHLRPFAGLGAGKGKEDRTIKVGFLGDVRAAYQRQAPYQISFRPDFEDAAQIVASFACSKLHDRPARFSGNAEDRTKKRVFGVSIREDDKYRAALLDAFAKTCSLPIKVVASDPVNDRTIAARMREAGVTTVITYSGNGTQVPLLTRQATQLAWFPEWFVPADPALRGSDTNFYARLTDQAQWRNAFGVTLDYRRDAIREQAWYRAYREGCPDCPEPTATGYSNAATLYDQLGMLFYGIQAAGPRLTPENVDKGLHSIPPRGSPDPYKPAAYFAPGNYSYVKDAASIHWDAAGTGPDGRTGCYRLYQEGRRFRAGEWPAGDDDLFRPGLPCQGDPQPG